MSNSRAMSSTYLDLNLQLNKNKKRILKMKSIFQSTRNIHFKTFFSLYFHFLYVRFLRGVPIFYQMQTDSVLTDAAEYMKPISFDNGEYASTYIFTTKFVFIMFHYKILILIQKCSGIFSKREMMAMPSSS